MAGLAEGFAIAVGRQQQNQEVHEHVLASSLGSPAWAEGGRLEHGSPSPVTGACKVKPLYGAVAEYIVL